MPDEAFLHVYKEGLRHVGKEEPNPLPTPTPKAALPTMPKTL